MTDSQYLWQTQPSTPYHSQLFALYHKECKNTCLIFKNICPIHGDGWKYYFVHVQLHSLNRTLFHVVTAYSAMDGTYTVVIYKFYQFCQWQFVLAHQTPFRRRLCQQAMRKTIFQQAHLPYERSPVWEQLMFKGISSELCSNIVTSKHK